MGSQLAAMSRSRKDHKVGTSHLKGLTFDILRPCNNYKTNVLHPADFQCFGYMMLPAQLVGYHRLSLHRLPYP